jgi:photosystem II stability/assembly factor-like uncharacterized protein
VGAEDGLFRTADNGHNWRLMSHPTSWDLRGPVAVGADGTVYDTVLVDPLSGSAETTIGRSEDSGRHWQRVGKGITWITTITADPSRPNVVYATGSDASGNGAALYRSSDHGGHFQLVFGGAEPDETASIAVDPKHPCTVYYSAGSFGMTIYRSRDCGHSWTAVYQNPSISKGILSLAVDQTHPHIVYAGLSSAGLLRSTDHGRRWKTLSVPGGGDVVAVQSAPSGRLYAAVGNQFDFLNQPPYPGQGIYMSVDHGVSWQELPTLPAVVRTLAIGAGGGETVFAGTWDDGVLVTSPP